ncbi:MAG TPA: hypothetical protein VNQ99_12280 [Xanthobacteraceae bacterium]|nr:hypothetical protein [Xanthobacteraceae bacterium]
MATRRTTLPRVDIDPNLSDYLEGLERLIYALQDALKAQGGGTETSLTEINQRIDTLSSDLTAKTFPVMPAQPDLDPDTADEAEISTAHNALLAALRTSGRMDT